MKNCIDVAILSLMWDKQLFEPTDLISNSGEIIEVEKVGDMDIDSDMQTFFGATIKIGNQYSRGAVKVTMQSELCLDQSIALVVTADPKLIALRYDGTSVPMFVIKPSDQFCALYNKLKEGAKSYYCAQYIANASSYDQISLLTRLFLDRLNRKFTEVNQVYNEGRQDWNYTLYVMLFRAMAGPKNKETFMKLARAVPYSAISHEKASLKAVEAMLLGAAGFLDNRDDDEYMTSLDKEFEYFAKKYSIKPIRRSSWDMTCRTLVSSPIMRIVQLASFLATKEFVFDNMIACHTHEDLTKLFQTQASDYWTSHSAPSKPSQNRVKHIGRDVVDRLGINFVVPLMFTYAHHTCNETLRDQPLALLELIPAEHNGIITAWKNAGVKIDTALESQGMLQLTNEYCKNGRCALCPVGKRVIITKFK